MRVQALESLVSTLMVMLNMHYEFCVAVVSFLSPLEAEVVEGQLERVCVGVTNGVLEQDVSIVIQLSGPEGCYALHTLHCCNITYVHVVVISNQSSHDVLLFDEAIMFLSGDSIGATECFNISTVDDNSLEVNETYLLSIETDTNGVEIINGVVVITIIDNDGKNLVESFLYDLLTTSVLIDIEVGFKTNEVIVGEEDGEISLCVELQRGTLERNITVAHRVISRGGILKQTWCHIFEAFFIAIVERDFVIISEGDLSFSHADVVGECKNLTLQIINDSNVEVNESFYLELLMDRSISGIVNITQHLSKILIIDDDSMLYINQILHFQN